MGNIKYRLLNIDFWASEFAILLLGNYFRWMNEWNIISFGIISLIFLITIQYCVFHTICLFKSGFKWCHILFAELCYIFSTVYVLIGNIILFNQSYQINFCFLVIWAVILLPITIISTKLSKTSKK